jgi:2-C-methyl-D-erythritol 4-phosphate cytidylyltransferase
MKYFAIIVGGGSGKRMENIVAKQFLLLQHQPILMHTIEAFARSKFNPEIIVVIPSNAHHYWQELCLKYNFNIPHQLIEGGKERFHSVRNGLMAVKDNGYVAIHDAVRPLVSTKLIDSTFEAAQDYTNAIPTIQSSDSVRKIKTEKTSKIVKRDQLVFIQTPQTFETSQLRKAYQMGFKKSFTDDASVVENAGFPIHLMKGERTNFKITFPEDLELANLLLK